MMARVVRVAYTLGWCFLLPVAALYLSWRAIRQPAYWRHWSERFLGAGPAPRRALNGAQKGRPVIWVHAVSVGETRAAQPLIELLARAHPQAQFVLTHMTPTGRDAGATLAAPGSPLAGRITQRYLPYDLPYAMRRLLRSIEPTVGVMMETEVWPNLLHEAKAANVPIVLVNARLSEKSAAKAQRVAALIRPAGAGLTRIVAQSAADAARFALFYEGPIDVFGNMKFDLTPDAQLIEAGRALRQGWGDLPVWLAASTREGEEVLILDAYMALARVCPAARLLLVPRHPQRFDDVARLLAERGFATVRRHDANWRDPPAAAVLFGDSMGEMPMYYAAADVALIGGSLLPFGAQNLIESCAVGTPVVLGPSTFNFAQAATDALAAGAAVQVADAPAALAAMQAICADRAGLDRMRQAALSFAAAHRGATARTAAVIGLMMERGGNSKNSAESRRPS
jgi:3-deoxy-D-manno-octulosonic-acid transferase